MRRCGGLLAVLVLMAGTAPGFGAPTLDIGLLINGAVDVVTYDTWPLLLEVSFANQGAVNDALYNREIVAQLAELDALVAAGDISETEAEEVRSRLTLREIEAIVLGADDLPWETLVFFADSEEMLPWPIELLAVDVPSSLVLDETAMAVVWYGLDPRATGPLPTGTYEIRLVVSTAAVDELLEGAWSGTAASAPVRVEILPEPERTPEIRVEKAIAFGQYELYRGHHAAAEGFLLDAIELDPTAVDALVLLGDAQYAQGKLVSALESYHEALAQIGANDIPSTPHSEPPSYILLRIAQIERELGTDAEGQEP